MFLIRSAIQYSLLVFIFSVFSLTATAQYDATPLISWHPDGSMLAVTNVEGVTILDGDTLKTLNELPGTIKGMVPEFLVSAEWSPDGRKIALFNDMNIEIWEVSPVPIEASLTATILIAAWPTSVTWSPDGLQLAISIDEALVLTSAESGRLLGEINGDWSTIYQLIWTFDNRLALSSTRKYAGIVDPSTGNVITSFYSDYWGLTSNTAIAFSHDGNRIAIGDNEGFIEIRNDTRTPREYIKAVPGVDQSFWIPSQGETGGEFSLENPSQVLDLDWSFDGRYLASASNDGTVRIWNPDTGENLTTITVAPGAWVGSAAWRPNTLELAYGNLDGSVTIVVPENVVPAPDAPLTPTPTEDE